MHYRTRPHNPCLPPQYLLCTATAGVSGESISKHQAPAEIQRCLPVTQPNPTSPVAHTGEEKRKIQRSQCLGVLTAVEKSFLPWVSYLSYVNFCESYSYLIYYAHPIRLTGHDQTRCRDGANYQERESVRESGLQSRCSASWNHLRTQRFKGITPLPWGSYHFLIAGNTHDAN